MMSRQQSLFVYTSPGPSSPKASHLDNDVSSCASSSDQTEPEEQETARGTETVCMRPNQPRGRTFPKKKFGQVKPEYRAFKESWFDNQNWSKWLHWEEEKERVYCIICRNVHVLGQLTMSKNKESAFITTGFNNWKDAVRSFELHRRSLCHREALIKWENHVQGISISTQIQTQLSNEQEKARSCQALHKLFTSIEYLARQGLPLRGHTEASGNFYKLLQLRSEDSPQLISWLSQRRAYTSHEIQNEMLKIMSCQIQRSILNDIQSSLWYSISADEVVDASLCEQLTICIRYLCPQTYEVYEDCIGLYSTERTNADCLTRLIKDVLVRSSLLLSRCRGQCYDGAANMSGRRSGVATQILHEEPRATYLHCMGHSLNLAVQDTCRSIKVMSDTFDTLLEISKAMKYSAKKKAMLLSLKQELSPSTPSVRPLCPTRWTVRAESLRSVIANYEVLQELMEEIIEEYRGITEATSSAKGILSTMEKFSFLFGVVVSQLFFSITDKLSKAVQTKSICAFEATEYASVTLKCLEEERSEDRFNCLWEDLMSKKTKFGVGEPVLPRKRRAPTRLDQNSSNSYYDESPKEMYRRIYYEIADKLKGEIERRYSSPAFALYTNVELILRKAATGESIPPEVLSEVFEHFGDDLQRDELTTELGMLKNAMVGAAYSIDNMKEKIRKYQELFPQISRLLQLLLVMPATSATSERSFSSLRHIKTYLRTTMRQDRLNHLMMLYIHKDRKVSITDAMKEFVLSNDERKCIFGNI